MPEKTATEKLLTVSMGQEERETGWLRKWKPAGKRPSG